MLTKPTFGNLDGRGLRIGIAVSRFNEGFTKNLLDGASAALAKHGVAKKNITTVWVPGAFEIPFVLSRLARKKKHDALIALGVVIQGATVHADIINQTVAQACHRISLESGVPVIDGVVGVRSVEQAVERAGAPPDNRGWNAALTAIDMARVAKSLK
jgi:6,7-dimethyl-8-ribityllumazine synthase